MMQIDTLYHLCRADASKVVRILLECFRDDPLYKKLIPEDELRDRTLPEVFACDAGELLENDDAFADGPDINGLIIVDDDSEPYNHLKFFSVETFYAWKTSVSLIKDDTSLKTLWQFLKARQYLNAGWTKELPAKQYIHIIYFAVRPEARGTGMAHKVMVPVLKYADQKGLLVSLETHNEKNLPMYQHYGFELYTTLETPFDLLQYCMVRKPGTLPCDPDKGT
jgi:GNAT superfamily N-acetyltransferase